MDAGTRRLLKSLGCELSHGLIEQTQQHLAACVEPGKHDPRVLRDIAYGPDERHVLDLFLPAQSVDAPVLLFVHGGGFVMGDKRLPMLPFYDNIGQWAARCGWIGVTINYRLAPDHMWPAGAEDISRAISWLRDNVADHHGAPDKIFAMGQAAGASHLAAYLALPHLQPEEGAVLAGAILVSGNYDPSTGGHSPYHLAYYGTDRERYGAFSTVHGLVSTRVPLCIAVSEFDAIDCRRQAAQLVGAFGKSRGDIPRIHWLAGHNHLSPVLAIGTSEDGLGPLVRDFMEAILQE